MSISHLIFLYDDTTCTRWMRVDDWIKMVGVATAVGFVVVMHMVVVVHMLAVVAHNMAIFVSSRK